MKLELDKRNKLINLLVNTGKAETGSRSALCQRIGVNTGRLDFGGTDQDFATRLVNYLNTNRRYSELIALCDEIEPELGDNFKSELDKIRDRIQQIVESPNQQVKQITRSENLETSSTHNREVSNDSSQKPSQVRSGGNIERNRELLSKIEEVLFDSRTDATLTESFLHDIRPDIVSILRELRKAYDKREFTPFPDSSLKKTIAHLNEAVNSLNAALAAFEEENKSYVVKVSEAYKYCEKCETSLYEAQLLLETP